MSDKRWQTYEEVAVYLLNTLSSHFGVGRFEGKQIVPGSTGTAWELDGKGCSDGGTRTIVVECKRHIDRGINQSTVAALAFTIRDVGGDMGILVSPLGLQEGAKIVANHENIIEVVLDQNSTTTDYVLSFLNQINVGWLEAVLIRDSIVLEEVCVKK